MFIADGNITNALISSLREQKLIPVDICLNAIYYVWYNRVPKCGSTTVLRMIKRVAPTNGFQKIGGSSYTKPHISLSDIVSTLYRSK